jgi:hypothetical protein
MKPAEIEQLAKRIRIRISAASRDHILADAEAALTESRKPGPEVSKPGVSVWRTIMKNRIAKLAAVAVILVAAFVGLSVMKLASPSDPNFVPERVLTDLQGPLIHKLDDGSIVELAEGAGIRLYDSDDRRGFEHLAGEIEVTVAEAARDFVVTTAFGTVKALGTIFTMDLIDAVPEESSEEIEMLAVLVKEGSVEVSNSEGSRIITDNQSATIEKNREPYDFRKDESLPARLVERIQAMLDAFAAGDKRAWIANFNIKAFYDLVKGNIEYSDHPDWFSGMSADDAKGIREEFADADVESPEEMAEHAAATVNIDKPKKVYVQSVTVDPDGKHATARCVEVKGHRRYTITTPQWTYFDNDWWQTDD